MMTLEEAIAIAKSAQAEVEALRAEIAEIKTYRDYGPRMDEKRQAAIMELALGPDRIDRVEALQAAEAEVERMRAERDHWKNIAEARKEANDLADGLTQNEISVREAAEAEVARLKEALLIYADDSKWVSPTNGRAYVEHEGTYYQGSIARTALKGDAP